MCAGRLAVGERCDWWTDCESRSCTGSGVFEGVCVPGDAPMGAPCIGNDQCAGDACDRVCVPPVCFELGPAWHD